MRRRGAVLLGTGLAALLAVTSAATPQDAGSQTHYWAHRAFNIPLNVDKLNQLDPKPTELQLYYMLNRGSWQRGAKLPVSGLQDIGDGRKGFRFSADRDGDYEFSVQYGYSDGSTSPKRLDELPPMLSVVIDTTPPLVRLSSGPSGVRWEATDDNLDPRSITLQCKYPHWTEWREVNERALKPVDNFAWKMPPGQVLEVRVLARDRAGNQGYSPIVRVPADAAVGTAMPKSTGGGTPDWLPGGGASRDPLVAPKAGGAVPEPRYSYVKSPDITVEYTIQRIGRSGIRAARLYELPYQGGTGWKLAKEYQVNLLPSEKDQTLSLNYPVQGDGVYGFYVAPESGAGVKADPPRKDDPPMMIVVVDGQAPHVKITGIRVSQGVRGPVVEVAWETYDKNLMADPISLEYSLDKDALQWKEIKYRLPPGTLRSDSLGQSRYVGQYAWEITNEDLWKFYVRIRSVDLSGNTGKDVWCGDQKKDVPVEVIVDLEKPAASVTGVKGGGGAASPAAPTRPSASPSPTPPASLPATPSSSPSFPDMKSPSSPGSGPPVPAIPEKDPGERVPAPKEAQGTP